MRRLALVVTMATVIAACSVASTPSPPASPEPTGGAGSSAIAWESSRPDAMWSLAPSASPSVSPSPDPAVATPPPSLPSPTGSSFVTLTLIADGPAPRMLELYSQPDMAWHAVCDRIDGCTRLSIRVPLGMPMTTKVISETELTLACPGGPGQLDGPMYYSDGLWYVWCGPIVMGSDVTVTTMPPVPELELGRIVYVTDAGDGLRVRSKPSTDADSLKYEPLLAVGAGMTILEGPVAGSGLWWYRVHLEDGLALEGGRTEGWVAAGSRDGTPWIGVGGGLDCGGGEEPSLEPGESPLDIVC